MGPGAGVGPLRGAVGRTLAKTALAAADRRDPRRQSSDRGRAAHSRRAFTPPHQPASRRAFTPRIHAELCATGCAVHASGSPASCAWSESAAVTAAAFGRPDAIPRVRIPRAQAPRIWCSGSGAADRRGQSAHPPNQVWVADLTSVPTRQGFLTGSSSSPSSWTPARAVSSAGPWRRIFALSWSWRRSTWRCRIVAPSPRRPLAGVIHQSDHGPWQPLERCRLPAALPPSSSAVAEPVSVPRWARWARWARGVMVTRMP